MTRLHRHLPGLRLPLALLAQVFTDLIDDRCEARP